MTDPIRDQPGEWYVTTGPARDNAARLAGPFDSKDEAIAARNPIEAERGTCDLWVLDASDPDCPADTTEGE